MFPCLLRKYLYACMNIVVYSFLRTSAMTANKQNCTVSEMVIKNTEEQLLRYDPDLLDKHIYMPCFSPFSIQHSTEKCRNPERSPSPSTSTLNLTSAEQFANGSVALKASEFMVPGKNYYSPSKTFRLTLQTDQNLVLYRECDSAPVFASRTEALPPAKAFLSNDGNFMLGTYNINDRMETLYWDTATWGYGESRLLVSDLGFFYLCNSESCYWRSAGQRNQGCNGISNYAPATFYHYGVILKAEEEMDLGSTYYSKNGDYSFIMYDVASNNYLTVVRKCDCRQGFRTASLKRISSLHLYANGNLVAYDSNGSPVWWSITSGNHVDPELRLYDNGFLYLCDQRGCYWQSSGFIDACNPKNARQC
ncbi:uncharacterized protein LOC129595394 [Paramacrobiotus metropolitanus]|uniref:uncharacterized protein LOC129595394 n=1 Tax=Paramacrobiotus metropolitanus TaxID=2943436 RepID=UPI002446199F|nr:uncharacterized protein LOC129595394 [Paramacrobiotus metropolitanus]